MSAENDMSKLINGETYERFVSEIINSSCGIEGNKLTLQQTTELLFGGINIDIVSNRRDIYDTLNSKNAWNYLESVNTIRIPEIKNVGILVNKDILNIDGFKTSQNYIKGSRTITAKPEQVQIKLQELCDYFEQNDNEDKYMKIAQFHLEYERTHPFQDGNGRSGRLIMYRQAQLLGIKMHIIRKSDRTQYMQILEDGDIKKLADMLRSSYEC